MRTLRDVVREIEAARGPTPVTDAALFNHPKGTRAASLDVVAAVAECSRRLELALVAMKRCPGIDNTDQETGETFRSMIDAALQPRP